MDLTYTHRWVLYLALLAFSFAVQASSNCDATSQCLEDIADYEQDHNLEDSFVHAHDVVLLQLDVQLQAKTRGTISGKKTK